MLMPYKPCVFVVNPKTTANYRKSYIGMEKTDPADAFLIADFARAGRTKKLEPWRGSRFIALKRLTRHRMHLSECIAREKTYMVSNLSSTFQRKASSSSSGISIISCGDKNSVRTAEDVAP